MEAEVVAGIDADGLRSEGPCTFALVTGRRNGHPVVSADG